METKKPLAIEDVLLSRLFSIRDICDLYPVSPQNVREWIKNGELRSVDICSIKDSRRPRVRVFGADLLEFFRNRQIRPTLPLMAMRWNGPPHCS